MGFGGSTGWSSKKNGRGDGGVHDDGGEGECARSNQPRPPLCIPVPSHDYVMRRSPARGAELPALYDAPSSPRRVSSTVPRAGVASTNDRPDLSTSLNYSSRRCAADSHHRTALASRHALVAFADCAALRAHQAGRDEFGRDRVYVEPLDRRRHRHCHLQRSRCARRRGQGLYLGSARYRNV